MFNLKTGGILLAAFIAGAFVASPELRAYAAATIGSTEIIDESILSQDIKNGEVKTLDIADGNVTNIDILNNAVTTTKIATGAVGTTDIATNGVTASDIATNAVGSSEIADGFVGAAEIATDAVGAEEIAQDAVSTFDIADNSILSLDIATDAVTAQELEKFDYLTWGRCNVDPPNIPDGTAVTVQGTSGYRCYVDEIVGSTPSVIAVPPVTLEQGLVFVGSSVGTCSGGVCPILVRLHNPNDVTDVNGVNRVWSFIAFR